MLKHNLLTEGYREADEQINLYKEDRMPLKPGCDSTQVALLVLSLPQWFRSGSTL